jgi:hypothetical protein
MEQMVTLRNLNCDYLQGYLCGKPTAKSNLAAIILKNFSEMLTTKTESPPPAVAAPPANLQFG